MMKNVLIVFTVLAMASVANAGLLISVNGIVNPPDSEVFLKPSEFAVIDVHSDGLSPSAGYLMNISGPATYDIREALNLYNPPPLTDTILELSVGQLLLDLAKSVIPIPPIPAGKVIDLIKIHCEDLGDVTITLTDDTGTMVLDSQIIHQIPEPITFALLGLGGLFLRRRK